MNDTTVQVFDSFQPLKKAGETISLQASQTLGSALNGADLLTTTGTDTVYLQVDGPRLSLPADLVLGTYPAQGSLDSPDEYLPHIAIGRRTLAWERPGPTPSSPWLALLVVRESEWRSANAPQPLRISPGLVAGLDLSRAAPPAPAVLRPAPPAAPAARVPVVNPQGSISTLPPNVISTQPPIAVLTGPSIANQVPGATLKSLTIAQIQSQDALAYKQLTDPTTGCGLDPTTTVNVLFLPNDVLTNILPTVDELSQLCHVKQGSNDDETLIVIANRLPNSIPDPGAAAPEKHTVLLVSLERRSDLYALNTRKGSAPAAMVVLYQWTFTPSTGADFADAIQAIRYTPNGGVLRFGSQPTVPKPGQEPTIVPLVAPDGFLLKPLPLAPQGQANYCGPLHPYQPAVRNNEFAVRPDPQQLLNANPADPDDYSHACAFELGRLIAVTDAGILEDLKSVHGYLDLPHGFVATSNIPPALQKKDWGVDPAWADEPWTGALGDFSQLATADPSGVAAQAKAGGIWDTAIGAATQGVQIQTGGAATLGQIATATVLGETLQIQLADVYTAGH